MKVGYAILYDDGELVISKNHTILSKTIDIDYGEFEDDDFNSPWYSDSKKIKKVRILGNVKSNCMNSWFYNCENLTTLIDFSYLDVSECTDFLGMFCGCKSLEKISTLQNWNVSNGQNFSGMFSYCVGLKDLDTLENWNVSNGTDFSFMFSNCQSLENLNALKNWNVSNRRNFSEMFSYCDSLEEISLPNTLRYLDKNMFKDCNPNLKIRWKQYLYTYADLLEYKTIY